MIPPDALTFIGRILPDGHVIHGINGAVIAKVETLVDGVLCRALSEDGRIWRASGAFVGDWANFLIVEE